MPIPISNVTRRVVYAASGTGPYAFTFEILANTDIAVYRDDTLLTLTTDYSVTIAANGTGSITLVAAPTGATQIAIVGNRTIQRTTDFVTGGDFFANTVNDEMDQQTIFAQQNAEGLQRALSAPQTDPTTINMTLPRASVRASKVLSFDAIGNPAATEFIGSNRGNWASGTLYYVRDIIKDTTNSNIWQCIVQHTSSGSQPIGTNADAAKWTLLVDAAAAATSATNAAASASAAATSASNASTSASNASSSASTASTQASNASTSATNAASSASAASSSASTASTAATNAGNSATAAATSATNASNSASAASTSASNASSSASAASTSASNASTSATNAANSASTATTQATNASNSASTASTQATNAASSATAAAASATSAAASYDAFDDRYLGALSSNPTLDNDGNALLTGAIYFNSVANTMRVYNGTAWQDQAASPDTIAERSFAATAGQTSYTFTGGYRVGYTYVYVNGALLAAADITATDGTTITFTSALSLNDEVRILSYKAIGSVVIGDISGLQTALDAKQATLVSDTNIKTVNSTSLLGSGNVAVQPTLVSGTNIKTVGGASLLGSGDLVIASGTITGTASGAISAGQAVQINTAGTLSAPTVTYSSAVSGVGTFPSAVAANSLSNMYYHPTSGRYVIAYLRNSDNYPVVATGTQASDGTITFSNETVINAATGAYATPPVRLAYCESIDRFVVLYYTASATATLKAIDISSTGTATLGTASGSVYATSAEIGDIIWATNVSRLLWAYKSDSLGTAVYSIYTLNPATLALSSTGTNATSLGSTFPRLAYDPVNAKVVLLQTASSTIVGFVGTATTTNITWGSQVIIQASVFSQASLYASIAYNSVAGQFGIMYPGSSPYAAVLTRMITVSGTSLTVGTQNSSAGQGFVGAFVYDPSYNRMVVFYSQTTTSYPAFRVATVSGSTLTYGAETVISTTATASASYASPACANTSGSPFTIGMAYVRSGPVGAPFAITLATSTLNANNFIGFSTASYTNGQTATVTVVGGVNSGQTGLTPGLKYYVSPAGTLSTTSSTLYAGISSSATALVVKG